jgi:hypothetical protein
MATMGRGDGVERCEPSSSVVVHFLLLRQKVDCPTATTVPDHLLPFRAPNFYFYFCKRDLAVATQQRQSPSLASLESSSHAVGTNVWRRGGQTTGRKQGRVSCGVAVIHPAKMPGLRPIAGSAMEVSVDDG